MNTSKDNCNLSFINCKQTENICIISSNTGSLFSNNKSIFESWNETVLKHINDTHSSFIVLNLQEFGGKNYVTTDSASWFLESLYASVSKTHPLFISFVDFDTTSEESYTALCTIFMFTLKYKNIQIFDFFKNEFTSTDGKYCVNTLGQNVGHCMRHKFPLNLFPNRRWSRKGFLISRVKFPNNFIIDFVNLHLIHDSDCKVAIETIPSVFSSYRKRQLDYVLDKLDHLNSDNAILCGDFNFRISLHHLLKKLDNNYVIEKDYKNNNLILVRGKDQRILASVASKEICLEDYFTNFTSQRLSFHQKCDLEFDEFKSKLLELPIHFLPTYCFVESSVESSYDKRRCPSWCDRIIFRGKIGEKIRDCSESQIKYESLGSSKPTGDHKPVSIILPIELIFNKGS